MEGYAKIATFMANERCDDRYLIFKKFSALSAQNLLHLQAELYELQIDLSEIVQKDAMDQERKSYARNWLSMSSAENSEQWDKWLEIRPKLKEYHAALQQHMFVMQLAPPNKRDHEFLRDWMCLPHMKGNGITGMDRKVYLGEDGHDLATLKSRDVEVEDVAMRIANTIVLIYHRAVVEPVHWLFSYWLKDPEEDCPRPKFTSAIELANTNNGEGTSMSGSGSSSAISSTLPAGSSPPTEPDLEKNLFFYPDARCTQLANAVGALLSSLIPITAIVILYLVQNMSARLAIVCAFTAIFSFSLALLTRSRRIEVFAATAAFASVQVVFVGSTRWN